MKKDSIFLPESVDGEMSVPLSSDTDWIESSHGRTGAGRTQQFVNPVLTPRRRSAFLLAVLLCFGFLLLRVSYLQIVRGVSYRGVAEGNRQRIIPIPSERGLLFDVTGVQLTKNVPSFSLALVPQDLPRSEEERNTLIETLASLVELEVEEVRETINKYGSYSYESIIIEDDLDYEAALKIHIASADIPGIHIHRGSKRLYIEEKEGKEDPALPLSLSHVLGYLGKLSPEELDALYEAGYLPSDTLGKTGIEKQYEPFLRGTYGVRRIEVDSLGKEQNVLAEEAPEDGSHVTLTIDLAMQRALEKFVQKRLDIGQFSRAAAIAMVPDTGEIRALVSVPGFDNNDFSGGIDYDTYQSYITDENRPLFNRAIAGTYPSGSTIKPAVAAAALEEGVITAQTSFLSSGGIQVGPWFFPDWKTGGHGRTNVKKSIAESVNTFYYIIGGGYNNVTGLGVDRIAKYLQEFGFAARLGIDLPGEALGFLPSKRWKEERKGERWYVGDTYNLSIGQGDLLVTPLQLTSYIASIANGGTLYKPQVVEATTDMQTGSVQEIHHEAIRELPIEKRHIGTIQAGMRDCVTYGSCRRLSLLPFNTAGKTGTAQWSNTKEPHAWFSAYAPATNPELVITVLIEEGEEGSGAAVPVAFDFLNWWWKYKSGSLDG